MSIVFISKEGEKFEMDKLIADFVKYKDVVDKKEEISFKETISSKFLQIVKEFYEKNEFNKEKMQVKKNIASNNLQENLVGKINYEIMKPYFTKAAETKNLEEIFDFIKCAEMFQAQEIIDLIKVTFQTIIFCGDTETEQNDYTTKWELQSKQPTEQLEELMKDEKKIKIYQEINAATYDQYQKKLQEILNPPAQNANLNHPVQAQNQFQFGQRGMFG
eukprot:TRINITY_DN7719_c0_g1_i1.p1 TRINITY_DN7719_c0_g1~~TRINITY_DN7719_c0_g1_i1.p1  ORF type:complete len:218 (-),score=64.98 TRINITY_DN7719_c0_g1_i1:113-766(-)